MIIGNVLKNEIYNTFVKSAIKDSCETEVQQFTLQELSGFVNDHLKKKGELKSYLIKRFKMLNRHRFIIYCQNILGKRFIL